MPCINNSRIHRIKNETFARYFFKWTQTHIGKFSNLHYYAFKVGLSFVCFNEKSLKIFKKFFLCLLRSQVFKSVSWVFGYEEKTAWLEK